MKLTLEWAWSMVYVPYCTGDVHLGNYLGAKYDIPLNTGGGAADVYAGDESGNGDYDLDVFGVGADGTNSVTDSGAAGFVLKRTAGYDLPAAVQAIQQGGRFISPGVHDPEGIVRV
mgnify:CR=1 FL=1